MKKLLAILFVTILIFSTSLAGNTAHAQTEGSIQEGQIKIGAGLVYGSGIRFSGLNSDFENDLGIRVDGYYAVTPEIRAGGDFTFYFPKEETISESSQGVTASGSAKQTVWELNINGHYIIQDEDGLILYALAGINITGINAENEIEISSQFGSQNDGDSRSESEVGLNLGGGLEYALDFADLFAEAKLGGLGGDADQFALGVGLRFPI